MPAWILDGRRALVCVSIRSQRWQYWWGEGGGRFANVKRCPFPAYSRSSLVAVEQFIQRFKASFGHWSAVVQSDLFGVVSSTSAILV
eukprot:3074452-Lingulodinium_polyedra.AAC.1